MGAKPEFAPTEARVFRAYWQDGVLDLLAGAAGVSIGFGWLGGFLASPAVVAPLALVLWPLLRQRITKPRLGQVRFNAERRFRMRHGMIAVLSLGILLFGFVGVRVLKGGNPEWLRWLAPGIPAFLVAALGLSAAEALRLSRFVVYAAAFAAAGLIAAVVDADPGWALVAGGAVPLVNGGRMLRAFVRQFPRLPAEMDE